MLSSRYAKTPDEFFCFEFSMFDRMLEAAGANYIDEHRRDMQSALMPFWVEHSKTLKMDFGTLCEKLSLQRPKKKESAKATGKAAQKAIERAESIRRADTKRVKE